MNKLLGVGVSALVLMTVACDKNGSADAASSGSTAAAHCPAGSTEAPGEGWCIKLPPGFKFEKKEGDTVIFVNDKYDRFRIEHSKNYTFKNTPDDFKSMVSNKPPTQQGVLLGGKGGWAYLDEGKGVATASVRINHPKGGMLDWSTSSDSKSGKVKSEMETVKTITLLSL